MGTPSSLSIKGIERYSVVMATRTKSGFR